MRVILYTGKGGVGKTTVAAATALNLARSGKRVMIMSTDQAHSLCDSLGMSIGSERTVVTENLDALEIDVVQESEEAWGSLKGYMKRVLTAKAAGGIEVEELLVFPGLEELFSLFKILDIYSEAAYDVLIVDCAPTGETLSLLKFPEMFGNFIENILPMKKGVVKVAGPVVEKVAKVPMPGEDVFDDLERLMHKLKRLQELMLNKEVLSIRIVTTPEKIVIQEAKRNFTCLHLYNYNVDAIIVNKVYPEEALKGYFNMWVQLQQEGLENIKQSFSDVPRFMVQLQKSEVKTLPVLEAVSAFYGESDPAAVLFSDEIFTVKQDDDGQAVMKIALPFADKAEMKLEQKGGELRIAVKNEKRCFMLPDQLKGMEIQSAKLAEGMLRICFVKGA